MAPPDRRYIKCTIVLQPEVLSIAVTKSPELLSIQMNFVEFS